MARVMIIGYGPLPSDQQNYHASVCLRTRQLLKPILQAGHTVNLFTLPAPGSEGPEAEVAAMTPGNYEGLAYQRFTSHSGQFAINALTQQAQQLQPDAIVGVNTYPAYIGAMLATTIPLWADLNGSWMSQMQGRCWIEENDARLIDAWSIERIVVRRMDKFSAVSRPHLHSVLGELGAVGRMNQYTYQYQFGHHLPCATPPRPAEPQGDKDESTPLVRGPLTPSDAFIILWCGGFEPRSDVSTMMAAMNTLMAQYPMVHFVSTGGRVDGIPSQPFQTFEELIEQSPHKDRFHHLGWLPAEQLPRLFREANLGINVDSKNYETLFCTRQRLHEMASHGLAVASTVGTEVSEWLDDGQAMLSAPMGDPAALAEAIEPWIEQPEQLRLMAAKARAIIEEDFSYERTAKPLLAWLQAPRLAPDNQAKLELSEENVTDLNSVTANSLEEEAMLLMRYRPHQIHEALTQLQESKAPKPKRSLFGVNRYR